MSRKSLQYFLHQESNFRSGVNFHTFKGWVKFIRKQRDVTFLGISDGSSHLPLQVIIPTKKLPSGVSFGSCVNVKGQLVQTGRPKPPVEVQADDMCVEGDCDAEVFPITKTEGQGLDYHRQYLHLRPRTTFFSSLLRLRSAATAGVHNFFQENDFTQIHTPVLTSNDCEGAGEVFQINQTDVSEDASHATDTDSTDYKYFKCPVNLTVSGQLHLEAMAGALSKVYTFGPTFRADSSRGRHHLAEFYMIEAEEAFIQTTEDICETVEDCLKFTSRFVLDKRREDFELVLSHCDNENHMNIVQKLIEKPFIRMPYADAIKILTKANRQFKYPPKWGRDLQKEHEKYIVSYCEDYPVFIMDFPASIKPFYARENGDSSTVAAVDLLVTGVGEVCGGSLREERLDVLTHKMDKTGVSREGLEWYLDLRRFGTCAHGGFGIGFERYLQFLFGVASIKDVIPFPRTYHSCKL